MISILKSPNLNMNPSPISVALLSLCFFFLTFSPCSNGQAGFTGDISINCGSTGASAATNGRQWLGDVRPKLSPLLLQLRGLSTASTTINKLTSADPVPHKTARISRSKFSYAFQLNSGQKIIRLHFNPTPYRGFKGLRDFFTVEAGPFTLLGNFSASLTAHALAVKTFAKEFCLNIQQNQQLILTFSPTESSRSQDTYAFVNGIEIISMPHGRSYFDGGEIGLRVVGQNSMVYFDDSTALEIVHRLLDVGALAGFEIVKMSNSYDDSLASPSPLPPPQNLQSHTIRNLLSVLGYKHAIATVAVAVISVLSIILRKLREIWEAWSTEDEHKPSVKAERRCRLFKLAEIQSATRNFNSDLVIGRGGFGDVYKGHIDNKQTYVAVKRLKLDSKQGAREFLTEIETLSELRHINLVSLIGYCSQQSEMILVYEYMAGGTLDRIYKHGSDCSSLTWKQRLNICIGAARGLDYLHTSNGIIHRDVKASNILLDENFVAKISDFGLAKAEDRNKLQSHVSTLVRGTRGYFDPSYFITGKLTRKSDIYSFGVVLLEVLCGRRALDEGLLEEEQFLSNWAVGKINKGEVDEIVASNLREEICPSSLKTFVEVARRCLHEEPKHRPTMSQIVLKLEFALKQQNSNEANEDIISPENTEVKTVTSPSDASDYSEILGMLNSPGFTKLFNKVWKEQQSPGCGSS